MPAPLLVPRRTYLIELCSGERRHWQYLGEDDTGTWWRDRDSGREFSEASLMYAWTVLGEALPDTPTAPEPPAGGQS